MKQSIKRDVARHGYAFVPTYRVGSDMTAIADEIGTTITPWENRLVQELVPRASAPPNMYSGIFGLSAFPFHTDLAHWRLPPRYLLLRCVTGYPDVPTLLIDGRKIISAVTLDVLLRAVFRPRRPRGGGLILLRLCESTDEGDLLRWDGYL
jgi:L-asparagine oxygenase